MGMELGVSNYFTFNDEAKRGEMNIADDSFLSKWPAWIRWILVLPGAILVCFLASLIYLFLVSFLVKPEVGSYGNSIYGIIQSLIIGGVFVYTGSYLAPKYQLGTAMCLLFIIMAVVISIISISFGAGVSTNYGYLALHATVILISGGGAAYSINEELNFRRKKWKS